MRYALEPRLRRARWGFVALTLVLSGGCFGGSSVTPDVPLKAVPFMEVPHIVRRDGRYYLRYQIDVPAMKEPGGALKRVLYARLGPGGGYYFFSLPISHYEYGGLVERPLELDGFEQFAASGEVFWLDPDGHKTRLEVTELKCVEVTEREPGEEEEVDLNGR